MRALPASGLKAPGSTDGDEWHSTAMSPRLMRVNDIQLATDAGPNARIAVFDNAASTAPRHEWRIAGSLESPPLLSPDGKMALAFHRNAAEDAQLTVMNVETGAVVKRGSLLTGASLIENPVTWLPDGRYAYLVENRLIVSSPASGTETEVARLALPSNKASDWQGFVSGMTTLVASPDGRRVAFSWTERRGSGLDRHVWVADIDGTRLHRLTRADETSPLTFWFMTPSWSPDGRWVVVHLDMSATQTAPIFPPSPYDDIPPPQTVSGTTGCRSSQILVYSADAEREAITWPTLDVQHGVRVKAANNQTAWLSSCGAASWLP
ncbi:hypothetical protein [Roseateles asaccharophilus]|uniref:Uncharacterized protein n=1 Tax=Roseateles asaccharophilus TaxID=582607 RepID=A0ABU2A892_9BURK|nr:hypothetical protein [Roseateles asaccharophilus]MDR7333412.1 hypothetical protein [Roseateles asaccharophilus]